MSIVERSLVLSVEAVRARLLEGIAIPPELVNEALAVTRKKLTAKETKVVAYRGKITDKIDLENHTAQLAAADQIYSLAGLYAREKDTKAVTPSVSLEIDAQTGVMRITVGGSGQHVPVSDKILEAHKEPEILEFHKDDVKEVVRTTRRKNDSVWKLLLDEEVE